MFFTYFFKYKALKFLNSELFYRNSGLVPDTDASTSYAAIEGLLESLSRSREELEELWSNRKLKLDLCLQLRLFERDALEVCFSLVCSFLSLNLIF